MNKTKDLIKNISDYDFLSTYKVERDSRIKVKLLALHHLQQGKDLNFVSSVVLYDVKTVREWLSRFVSFDYEGLIEKDGRGRKPRLPPEQEESFKQYLDLVQQELCGGTICANDIQSILSDEFDCDYSISGVYALLDRLNIVWISGRSKHPKSSDEAIEQFKILFPDELEKIKNKVGTKNIEVWWQDESRVGQQGSLSRVWAAKGTRPRVVRQRQFMSTYIFGAVCPDRDIGCALILPECNSGMMQIHLDQISKQVQDNHHAVLLLDRATWHITEALIIPENISLMPLPPYSPELNPMEQVWQNLKTKYLSNTSFKNYEDIVDKCCHAWNSFVDEEGAINSLCSRNWAKI